MSDATIEVIGLRKRFGPALALDGMTFTVLPGRVTGFVGPNGAGKSTTISVLTGIYAPDGGTVEILGLDARAHALDVKSRIGVVPEELSLFEARDYLLARLVENRTFQSAAAALLQVDAQRLKYLCRKHRIQ